jgi:sterol carrier protein 2
MTSSVVVAGVGMVPFAKPGASATYDEMGATASRMALADAGIGYESVQQAYAGYVYGDSTAGQKAIYPLGLTGIPIVKSITIVLPALPPCFLAGRQSPPAQRTAF